MCGSVSGLGVSRHNSNAAVLAGGGRILMIDPGRFHAGARVTVGVAVAREGVGHVDGIVARIVEFTPRLIGEHHVGQSADRVCLEGQVADVQELALAGMVAGAPRPRRRNRRRGSVNLFGGVVVHEDSLPVCS